MRTCKLCSGLLKCFLMESWENGGALPQLNNKHLKTFPLVVGIMVRLGVFWTFGTKH